MHIQLRDENPKEVAEAIASIRTFPVWVLIDDGVEILDTETAAKQAINEPGRFHVLTDSVLCNNAAEIEEAIENWFQGQ